MQPFFAKKNRGQYKGEMLYPHLHSDGAYVATTSRYSVDYVRVSSLDELSVLVRSGYGARMSNPEIPQAPSYISHGSITFCDAEDPSASLKRVLSSFAHAENLDGETVANSRKEQAFLRSYLLRGKSQGECVLCGRAFPTELLVAAHIKTRAECSREEKLDFDNIAALMCVLGCDSLFEKGFVYVLDGKVHANPRREGTPHLDKAIGQLAGRVVANWPNSSGYYKWHAKEFGWKEQLSYVPLSTDS